MTAPARPRVQIYSNHQELICADQQCATSSDVVARKLAKTAGAVYTFFLRHFGINGVDGHGKMPPFHIGWDQRNAAWTCASTDNLQSCSLKFHDHYAIQEEVVAHEYTHAILHHFTSLGNTGEAGALHESIADVMAIVFKHNILGIIDWKIGNLRDLREHVTMQNLQSTDPRAPDNGNVHDNSRIPSHAFYMTMASLSAREDRGRIIDIWMDAAKELPADATFRGYARLILTFAAVRRAPQYVQDILRHSWAHVGITV